MPAHSDNALKYLCSIKGAFPLRGLRTRTVSHFTHLFCLLFLLHALCACGSLESAESQGDSDPVGTQEQMEAEDHVLDEESVPRHELAVRVSALLENWSVKERNFLEAYREEFKRALNGTQELQEQLVKAYEERGYALIFSDGQKLSKSAESLMETLRQVTTEGLKHESYQAPRLESYLENVATSDQMYRNVSMAPDNERAEMFWKLLHALRTEEVIELVVIEKRLTTAAFDDRDLPLVSDTLDWLERLFASKAALNSALREVDMLLLSNWFRYVYEMRYAKRIHPFEGEPNEATDIARAEPALELHFQTTDFNDLAPSLLELVPKIPEYQKLKEGLAFYQKLAVEQDHLLLAKATQRLHKGSKGDNVVVLQRRLQQEEYYEFEGEPSGVFDAALSESVRLYQEVHQLKETGKMDRGTRSSLNKSFAQRADQVAFALQRHRESELHQGMWRYGTVPVQARVNIPAFEATFFRDGQEAVRHRLVVGNNKIETDEETGLKGHYNRTRLFSREMTTIVLNPTWRVPKRIKEQELDENLFDEPDYYEKNNYEVVILDDGSERVVQLPGPNNALGLVKFLFPNEWSIYMHDTPQKQFFKREIRAYSHGCMRTHNALELAEWILTEFDGMSVDRFKKIVDSRETYGIPLKQKIPITIDYNTVAVHESGRMMFLLDVYRFDRDYLQGKTPYPLLPDELLPQVVLVE
jgi:murein L,D-transpeptidase YcbB/YkuD